MIISKKKLLWIILCIGVLPQLLFMLLKPLLSDADSIATITEEIVKQHIAKASLGKIRVIEPTLTKMIPTVSAINILHAHRNTSAWSTDKLMPGNSPLNGTADLPQNSLLPTNLTQLINVTKFLYNLHDSNEHLPNWQQNLKPNLHDRPQKYQLAEVLQVRIYSEDRAQWSLAELKQWMHYMFWGGVEHIYLCDHYKYEYEMLNRPLQLYIDLGLLTYIPKHLPRKAMSAQVECYQYVINKYKQVTTWQMAVDMDEYPLVVNDTDEGFLVRYVQNQNPDISELSMHNYLMLGQGDRSRDMTIDRINRRTPKPANNLDKPIYRPENVAAQIHHNLIRAGRVKEINDASIIMLHYWGSRLQNWGPDTESTISSTIEFNVMREIMAPIIRNSLMVFGETNAFNSTSGP